ncbi:cytochrome c oxidase subunit 3 [Roseomonas haemaphysalidis]|uniref:Cytochrome c oxidase subunit 3 n=1 Tax=Roseomonas haemaphysalidis TaxID=2768162 RepID=A0ABS3KKH6_9PROT|nr:cytochrome c oxidase subunit 3 [Roseomonas haemaphysalidis]MBO1077952.1 cytochrome c oxidase subunit 3 [Roseomonas haemaphysalidis]
MDVLGAERRHVGLNLANDPRDTSQHAESDVFGFWIFLMSDAVVFALLFAIYGTMLGATAGGPGAADVAKIGPAFAETLILLTSSFTFGMASIALKRDHRSRRLVLWLLATLALGLAFMAMEVNDFVGMAADGATAGRSGFLSAFHVLVGMHGLHVAAGIVWLLVMLAQLALLGKDEKVKVNLVRLSLFWHFLDIVWIAIFSVVYLQALIPPGGTP